MASTLNASFNRVPFPFSFPGDVKIKNTNYLYF